MPQTTWLDRAIGYWAPRAALRRAQARALQSTFAQRAQIAQSLLGRYYEAARPSRRTYGWTAGFTSADAEIYGSLPVLRARSRELVRNNPQARKAISALTNNTIGSGIIARAKTGDKALDKTINALWQTFIKQCDAEGHYDFYGLQKLAVRSFFEGGESLVRYWPRRKRDGFKVPLQLQVLEGDFLDHLKNARLDDGGRIVMGVELAPSGAPRAYWLYNEHPGDRPLVSAGNLTSARVDAALLQHLYEKDRPGQVRGVPWLHAAMIALREIDTYREAELVRKRLEACIAAILVNAEGAADPGTGDVTMTPAIMDQAGNKVEALEPGMTYYAKGATDIKFTNPATVAGYADYMRTEFHSAAAGALVTYELLTGDLSKVNYSSIRAGLIEFRSSIDSLQWLTVIPVLCEPVWQRFIDFSAAAGEIPGDTPYGVAYSTPAFEAVDQLKEYTADQIAVRSGFMTLPEAMARRGQDPDAMFEEMAATNGLIDQLKLVLDSDPRNTARTGAQQPGVVAGPSPAAGSSDEGAGERIIRAVFARHGLNGGGELLAAELVRELGFSRATD